MNNIQKRVQKDISNRLTDYAIVHDIKINDLMNEYHYNLYQLKLQTHNYHKRYTRLMYDSYKKVVDRNTNKMVIF